MPPTQNAADSPPPAQTPVAQPCTPLRGAHAPPRVVVGALANHNKPSTYLYRSIKPYGQPHLVPSSSSPENTFFAKRTHFYPRPLEFLKNILAGKAIIGPPFRFISHSIRLKVQLSSSHSPSSVQHWKFVPAIPAYLRPFSEGQPDHGNLPNPRKSHYAPFPIKNRKSKIKKCGAVPPCPASSRLVPDKFYIFSTSTRQWLNLPTSNPTKSSQVKPSQGKPINQVVRMPAAAPTSRPRKSYIANPRNPTQSHLIKPNPTIPFLLS